jgi:hypothetical protein
MRDHIITQFPRPAVTTLQLNALAANGSIIMPTQCAQEPLSKFLAQGPRPGTPEHDSNNTLSASSLLATHISRLRYEVTARDAQIEGLLADVDGLRRAIELIVSEHNALLQRNDMLREIGGDATATMEHVVEAWQEFRAMSDDWMFEGTDWEQLGKGKRLRLLRIDIDCRDDVFSCFR